MSSGPRHGFFGCRRCFLARLLICKWLSRNRGRGKHGDATSLSGKRWLLHQVRPSYQRGGPKRRRSSSPVPSEMGKGGAVLGGARVRERTQHCPLCVFCGWFYAVTLAAGYNSLFWLRNRRGAKGRWVSAADAPGAFVAG